MKINIKKAYISLLLNAYVPDQPSCCIERMIVTGKVTNIILYL